VLFFGFLCLMLEIVAPQGVVCAVAVDATVVAAACRCSVVSRQDRSWVRRCESSKRLVSEHACPTLRCHFPNQRRQHAETHTPCQPGVIPACTVKFATAASSSADGGVGSVASSWVLSSVGDNELGKKSNVRRPRCGMKEKLEAGHPGLPLYICTRSTFDESRSCADRSAAFVPGS